ncbi:MAG: hypothetical protein COV35_10895 [Alphaproteobacteria bacterium CG11_big_fil_rev_8_21_14_0_20_39_49]|nr:MAG: hypothetical protein COV35_10895 [Alphaproteobacteria bacterium CG11_big_fil_rev_8_21_14_0_20_39_49]
MFVFLDESGDLGFDWSKKGTSKYFTVTVLICHNKNATDKIRQAIKKTLRNKINHKKPKRVSKELKGTGTTIEIKKYFYSKLPDDELSIYSVTLNKKRVKDHLKTKDGKKKLYNFLAHFIIKETPLQKVSTNVNFVLDKCKSKAEIKDFNQYLENQLEAILPLDTRLNITHESSEENLCLQAVDLFCWGIFRKHNDNDKEWYDCFKEKIKYDKKYLP